ncbi:carotenoid oxygenase family protein [Sphingomonas populi]|uniref:Dioxygenase n=1 Tax=Sphingomonas populi TaxID=2484750 RepID=A0A4Q6XUA9_9SPHN|nr:carotenoid oxygenase family protein [Sphingomonas populi]RZF63870.1 carotenoid oxygenase family protein [Sphingomonas populi]
MATLFPNEFVYSGFMKPSRFEGDIFELEVEGEVPAHLDGTFYRVGPDPAFPAKSGKDIAFNGDGMVTTFTFRDGHVDFKSKYALTDKLKLERAARRSLFGAYRNPFDDDPSVQGQIRGTANTGIQLHGGRLLAMKEDSPPLEMDPITLDTVGYTNFGGKLTSKTFTAHPKVDPKTGEMFAIGYAAKGEATRDLAYYVISPDGEIIHEAWLEAPYSGMIHEFVIGEDYVAFPLTAVTSDIERLKKMDVHFRFDPSKDSYVGVLPRYGRGDEVRWFSGPNRFAQHFANGFQEGRRMHLDAPVAHGNAFPFFPDINGAPFDEEKSLCRLTRWTVDLDDNECKIVETVLSPATGEFPIVDDRWQGRPYRTHFMMVQTPGQAFAQGKKMIFRTIAKIDVTNGETIYHTGPDEVIFQEPIFIPRSPEGPEADGYLAFLITHMTGQQLSELWLVDTADFAAPPIAKVKLPIRLRPGLHGEWYERSFIEQQVRIGRARAGANLMTSDR